MTIRLQRSVHCTWRLLNDLDSRNGRRETGHDGMKIMYADSELALLQQKFKEYLLQSCMFAQSCVGCSILYMTS